MIRYLVMDVDGSLTDGKIYMGPEGEAMKAFSIKDGYVINFILKPAEIMPIIITARTSSIVQNRCDELGIEEVHQGKKDKLVALIEIIGENQIGDCAYFGDDIIDLKCMIPIKEAGGVVGCPADAVQEIKAIADYVCVNKAGEGALREFAEWIVQPHISEAEIDRRVNEARAYLENIEIGENDINRKIIVNDDFYYTVQSYLTKKADECSFESHRKYIDIQILISGEEEIDLADVSRLSVKEEYDSNRDVLLWNTPKRMSRITLNKGDCMIIYPEMAHREAVAIKGIEKKVLKVVGKVRT